MPERFPTIMDDTAFAFPVARIRVLETKLLDRQRFERMLDAADAAEVYRILAETEYAEALAGSDDPNAFEQVLGAEFRRVYHYLGTFVTEKAVLDSLLLRYDFHNLKVLLKQALLGEEPSPDSLFQVGTEPASALSQGVTAVLDGKPHAMPEQYADAVREAKALYEKSLDPQQIDIAVDRRLFEFGAKMARESKSQMLQDLWQAWVDLANFRSFARAAARGRDISFLAQVLLEGGTLGRKSFLDIYKPSTDAMDDLVALGNKTRYRNVVSSGLGSFKSTRSFTLFEKLSDNFTLFLLDPSKRISLGLEPVVAYLLAKENEIRNLRIILTGKINRLPAESIRERLRDVYV
ncbi:MAG: V-type ATP synthase subunit C [Bacillota bacterium]|nr:V-type ATP synthase subunit C [Bacillota bacterium]